MPSIKSITCHKAINSRGDWTIETKVTLDDGSVGVQTVPDGASKGENEAFYIPVDKAVDLVETVINDVLEGEDPFNQKNIDEVLINMDGTPDKHHLGGNSILSVSLAVAKACAVSKSIELYEYLADSFSEQSGEKKRRSSLFSHKLSKESLKFPTPLFNILNGGKHADNNLSFQEFMVIPATNIPYDKALEMGVSMYHALKKKLETDGFGTDVGDEGGFAPTGFNAHKALSYLKAAAQQKYKVGEEVFFGIDVAADSFRDGVDYRIKEENLTLTSMELQRYYEKLLHEFEIIYLEDPFYEKDLVGWKEFSANFSKKMLISADDLVVTNTAILKHAIENKLANTVIVKPNQVGTLTEAFDFIKTAQKANMTVVISHRSGDTAEDTFIADLALAVGADFIKSGAPARGERVAKYNRLLDIFYGLNS